MSSVKAHAPAWHGQCRSLSEPSRGPERSSQATEVYWMNESVAWHCFVWFKKFLKNYSSTTCLLGKNLTIKNIWEKNTTYSPPKCSCQSILLSIYAFLLLIFCSIICFLHLTTYQEHGSMSMWTHFDVVASVWHALSLCLSHFWTYVWGTNPDGLFPSWLSHLWMAVPTPATFRATLCPHTPRLILAMPRV